ncbi:MAG: hypothetical protein ACRBB0_25480 [Pelagimonas sp.]|uniref:hypothetical protein n=1 Tax=Pelagimonas sp. TaxID=2073170 RepID=UPI003D6B74C2
MTSRADIVIRAHAIGVGLTNEERIALGVTLIMTVLTPNCHMKVRFAARRVQEHAEALDDARLNGFEMAEVSEVDVPLLRAPPLERARPTAVTTLTERSFLPPEVAASGSPGRAVVKYPSLRAAWAWFSDLYDHPVVWFVGTVLSIAAMLSVAFLPSPF